jgi:hypothetical protein
MNCDHALLLRASATAKLSVRNSRCGDCVMTNGLQLDVAMHQACHCMLGLRKQQLASKLHVCCMQVCHPAYASAYIRSSVPGSALCTSGALSRDYSHTWCPMQRLCHPMYRGMLHPGEVIREVITCVCQWGAGACREAKCMPWTWRLFGVQPLRHAMHGGA